MSRLPTFPNLYEELLTLSLTDLKKWGFLKPDEVIRKWITLRKYGAATQTFQIRVNYKEAPFMQLIYKYRGTHLNYIIETVAVPSNLGKGLVWYFLCSQTGKRCRKLYFVNGRFVHRETMKACFYEGQLVSKKNKLTFKLLQIDSKAIDAEEALEDKYFKKQYAGKPTKRFLKFTEHVNDSLSAPEKYPEWFNKDS